MTAMETLFLTSYTPRLGNGRGVRTYGVIAALARSGPVEVAYNPFDGPEPAPEYATLANAKLTRLANSRGVARARAYATALLRRVPNDIARGVSPELAAAALRAPADTRVVADGPIVAAALLGVARRRPVVYCGHNLESSFRHDVPGESTRQSTWARFERRVLASSAESWMVSPADVAGARALCPAAHVRLVPNVVDVAAIDPVVPAPDARRAVFVADLTYGPNRTGLAFLRDEVWPLLRPMVPDAEIVVAGRGGEAADGRDGFRVLGFVDDLGALYASAAVVVVPLLHGGGSPLKFVEALAYGLPVVATPKAAAGLEVTAGQHYLEGRDAAQFAEQMASALQRRSPERLGTQARAIAVQRYSIEAIAEELRA